MSKDTILPPTPKRGNRAGYWQDQEESTKDMALFQAEKVSKSADTMRMILPKKKKAIYYTKSSFVKITIRG